MDTQASPAEPLPRRRPDILEEDELDQRNNFLHLLLGLVSMAETVLRTLPAAGGALAPEPEAMIPEKAPRAVLDLLR